MPECRRHKAAAAIYIKHFIYDFGGVFRVELIYNSTRLVWLYSLEQLDAYLCIAILEDP